MSRVGSAIITIPAGVKLAIENGVVIVTGPKGILSKKILDNVKVKISEDTVEVERIKKGTFARAYHGTARQLIANMIQGSVEGYEKKLELVGLGFKAQTTPKGLTLSLGYSHPIEINSEEGVLFKVDGNIITVSGIDKEKVGMVAARIKAKRVPDAYKGKGVRYLGEKIKTKEGKKSK